MCCTRDNISTSDDNALSHTVVDHHRRLTEKHNITFMAAKKKVAKKKVAKKVAKKATKKVAKKKVAKKKKK